MFQGKAIGVSIGCFLGMLPLLWYEPKKKRKDDEEEEKKKTSEKT